MLDGDGLHIEIVSGYFECFLRWNTCKKRRDDGQYFRE